MPLENHIALAQAEVLAEGIQRLDAAEERIAKREIVDVERTTAFRAAIEAACEQYGFHLVHFTPIGRPERRGFLPWISAHFEQLPIDEEGH